MPGGSEEQSKSKADKLLGRIWDTNLERSRDDFGPTASSPQSRAATPKEIGDLRALNRQAEDILKKKRDQG